MTYSKDEEYKQSHWLNVWGMELTEEDKCVLLEGQWLNDKLIHAAQLLMKHDGA